VRSTEAISNITGSASEVHTSAKQGVSEAELKVLSWNINGLSKSKSSDIDFVKKLCNYDVIFYTSPGQMSILVWTLMDIIISIFIEDINIKIQSVVAAELLFS
jgi:hypothetical protein